MAITNEKLLKELRWIRATSDRLITELINPSEPKKSYEEEYKERIKAGIWKKPDHLKRKKQFKNKE